MLYPRIKPVHHPVRFADGRIRIGTVQYGVGAEIQDDEHGAIWRLLELMDGTRDIENVVAQLGQDATPPEPDSVRDVIDTLIQAGFVEDAAATVPEVLSEAEISRYASNTSYFSWVDTRPRFSPYESQRRLKQARVTVLGLGGTGGAVAMSLAAAGVGHLRCLDFDLVEESNLSRQLMYTEADVGRSKVETTVEWLQRQNHNVDVEGLEMRVSSAEDLVGVMAGSDLLVLCADKPNPDIQLWTNEAALRTLTPWSMCLYAGPMVVTGLFVPGVTACYDCFLALHRAGDRGPDGSKPKALLTAPPRNAVIAPSANITGHLGALEALYFLTDMEPQTVGRVLHHNLIRYDHSYYIEPLRLPQCPACGGDRSLGESRPIPTAALG